jgi:DNA-binding PadR family transcriptional regulator
VEAPDPSADRGAVVEAPDPSAARGAVVEAPDPSAARAAAGAVRAAAAETAAAEAARAAAAGPPRGPGAADPLVGDLRRAGLLPLLVLHFADAMPCYGNQLMDRIATLTGGALAVNPNTMYPLLRSLEARGHLKGEWEHPERRSRRFYRVTPSGRAELARLEAELLPRLDRIAASVEAIRAEITAGESRAGRP